MKSETSAVIRIPQALNLRLDELAEKTGRKKSYYASKAIAQYLEDREDYLLAVAAAEEARGQRTYSLDEVEQRLGLASDDRASRRKGSAGTGSRRSRPRKKIPQD